MRPRNPVLGMRKERLIIWGLAVCLAWNLALTTYIFVSPKISDAGRWSNVGGKEPLSDAITLRDRSRPDEFLDIGRYKYGWTLMTPHRLEMHPGEEFSISCYGHECLPRFQVRNVGDTEGAMWINGNNTIGSQFGPLIFAFGSFNSGSTELARFAKDGTFVLQGDLVLSGQNLTTRLEAIEARIP